MNCLLFGFMIYVNFIDKGHQHKLIYSTYGNIKETDLITGEVADLLTNLQSVIHSIDYDYQYEYVYFTRFERNDILRFRYPAERPYISETVSIADKPVGVAVDSFNSDVYLTEYGTGKLYRCASDGSNKILILQDDPLYALTLDTSNRWMYYSTYTTSGKIRKSRLNGTEKQTIVNSSHRIYGLSIDAIRGRLFWMEYSSGDLKSSNFNGENEIKVVSTNAASTNIGIHVYGSNVYCATGTTIINVTTTSTMIKNIIYSDPERIFSVIVYKETFDVGSSVMNKSFAPYTKGNTDTSVDLNGIIDKNQPQFTFLFLNRLGVPTCAMLVYDGFPVVISEIQKMQ